jgi:thiol:disulfide interchange protein
MKNIVKTLLIKLLVKKLAIIFIFFPTVFIVKAQIIEPIKWSFDLNQDGKEVQMHFIAEIKDGWHLYDTDLPEGGPISTQVVYEDSSLFEITDKLRKQPQPVQKFDSTFLMDLSYFSDRVILTQKARLKTDNPLEINGYVLFMGCDDATCLSPAEAEFSFKFNENKESRGLSVDSVTSSENIPHSPSWKKSGQTLWLFILISVLAGLAAILTPCVFPMIPMTVSFFMRQSENKGKAIRNGLFFGFSIVLIYTVLGGLFSVGLFGPNAANILSTHWIPNLLFFILFLVFAISFFGAFEIILPGSLVNKTDSKAERGGSTGAFFMALTTVIVSFSCTGPFIGALIIEAVQEGGYQPMIGMFFFGFAFAAPFTLLAIFPSALSKLPKSGSWMNVVKVVFAFILLAFSLKFVSNIDQVYGFNFISREIYLSVWIVIFFLLGIYFLGKIRFAHDSEMKFIGTGRLFLSIATFTFVIYLFTGLSGAPLTSISALLPPQNLKQMAFRGRGESSKDFAPENGLCEIPKYAENLHLPHGLKGYFDYEQGVECAQKLNKPVFLVFKGHACSNCKKMENTVWADPRVLKILSEEYVITALYTDDRRTLPEEEWVISQSDGKVKKTLGKKNLDIQISKYSTNTIPFHVIIKPGGTKYTMGVTYETDKFLEFLRKGLH